MSGYLDLGSAALNYLLGPQTDPTADTENASVSRFSGNTRTDPLTRAPNAIALAASRPWAVGAANAGTVAYDGGSTLTGTGTNFLTTIPAVGGVNIVIDIPAANDPLGEGFGYVVLVGNPTNPTSDTSVSVNALNGGSAWGPYLGSLAGLTYHSEVNNVDGAGFGGVTEKLMYYDFGYALYQSAYKHAATTDGTTLMANADAVAKLWWRHPMIQTARRVGTPANSGAIWVGSRHEALGTLITWALRGCPGDATQVSAVWSYCYSVALASYNQWLSAHLNTTTVFSDVRDGGYALHWLTFLSQVHPDSATRADCLTKALAAATTYFIPSQFADGTWRAYNGVWWNATAHTATYLASQPFLAGLLLESLIDLHRAIRTNPTYSSQAATILASIKLGVEGAMRQYGGAPDHPGYSATTSGGTAAVRAMTYSEGDANLGYDATTFMPFVPGSSTLRWNDPAAEVTNDVNVNGNTLPLAVAAVRFRNATTTHACYYAALYETDPTKRASYLAFGEELFKAQWEYTDGDGYRSQWYTAAPKNKDWDEHMRAQMRGLAWRKMAIAGLTAEDITGGGAPLLESLSPFDAMDLIQNDATQVIPIFMADSANHLTGKTGLAGTLVVKIGKNAAAGGAPAGAIAETDAVNLPGWYHIVGNAADKDTLGALRVRAHDPGGTADDFNDAYWVRPAVGAANLKQINDHAVTGNGVATPFDTPV